MPVDPDFYELLGVEQTATAAEIRAAYRRAVRQAHPDAGGTAGMFRLVAEAYEVLSDPDERAAYDAWLADPYGNRQEPAGEPDREPAGTRRHDRSADDSGSDRGEREDAPEQNLEDDPAFQEYLREWRQQHEWDPDNPRRPWTGPPKTNWESDPDWRPPPRTALDRLTTAAWVLAGGSLTLLLIGWPETLAPAAVGEVSGSVRVFTVPAVAAYLLLGGAYVLAHPIKGSLAVHGLTLPFIAVWLGNVWPLAAGGERWFMASVVAMWAAWTVAWAFAFEMGHRRTAGMPMGYIPYPEGGWPEPRRGPIGRAVRRVGGAIARIPTGPVRGLHVALGAALASFAAIAYVMVLDPDWLIPAAARPDLAATVWHWLVAVVVVGLYGVLAYGAFHARGFGGVELIHLAVPLGVLAWWAAYGDLATRAEWQRLWALAGVWVIYRISLGAAWHLADKH
ncbi:J domain-containing protein [Jiangella aurantiaca]|uniref:J domain-containing protein n=1 Tax=Jiangella aurantiaca TaxID=2530373 RepID=UPI00193E68EB|nr:J domain-containing protein [Jiangella aurantiaca]